MGTHPALDHEIPDRLFTLAATSKWQAYDREPAFAISADGLLCQSRDEHQWQGGRANVSVTKGKHYYEATMTDEGACALRLHS